MKKAIQIIVFSIFLFHTSNVLAVLMSASLKVDNRVTYQKVVGFGSFGFSPQWTANLSSADIDLMWGQASNQMGYNIMRVPIYSDSTTWVNSLATIKRAKQNGAIVFGTPWSAPAKYKSNNSTVGGYVLEQYYPAYANWLEAFVQYLRKNGTDIDIISIQNEPDFLPSYASTIWDAAQFNKFISNNRSTISCRLMAPESLAFRRSITDSILNNADACSKLDIIGGHLYGGMAGLDYPLARLKNKEVWMTEFLLNNPDNQTNMVWSDVFPFIKSVNTCMIANMQAYVHYAAKRYYGMMGDGTYGTVNGAITKRGYAFSQFAKYVTGKTRIKHKLNDPAHGLFASAYQSSTADTVVVMLINESTNSYEMNLDLPFKTIKYQTVVTSTSKDRVATTTNLTVSTSFPTITLLPSSVSTLIFYKAADLDEPWAAEVDSSFFRDNFSYNVGYNVVPSGWYTQYNGGVRYEGPYTWGTRLQYFRPESVLAAGLYIRSNSSTVGTATYGTVSGKGLYLQPGKFRLTYSAVGWYGPQRVVCSVRNSSYTVLKSKTCNVTDSIHGEVSWQYDLNAVTTDTLDFDLTSAGYYQLNWEVPYYAPYAIAGNCEVLFGNILLASRPIIQALGKTAENGSITSKMYYNLQGFKRSSAFEGINIVRTTFSDGSVKMTKEWIKY